MKNRMNGIFSFDEVAKAIGEKRSLIISGEEAFLAKLPAGNWVGGTSPYSMSGTGGACLDDRAYVQEPPSTATFASISSYDAKSIKSVYTDAPENGFSVILVPAFSDVHVSFAVGAPTFPQFAMKPLIGWVTGAKLDDLGKVPAKVFDGATKKAMPAHAVVMHFKLPAGKYADIGIVNIFESSSGPEEFEFDVDSFEVKDILVNGKKLKFADYMKENKIDVRWPLVGNYGGAQVNLSFASVDADSVKLLAPVFKGVRYKFAKPMGDYTAYLKAFREKIPRVEQQNVGFTCNCILNYKYGELDGKKINELNGPFVFGEIAYQLLNQTLVYLTIESA